MSRAPIWPVLMLGLFGMVGGVRAQPQENNSGPSTAPTQPVPVGAHAPTIDLKDFSVYPRASVNDLITVLKNTAPDNMYYRQAAADQLASRGGKAEAALPALTEAVKLADRPQTRTHYVSAIEAIGSSGAPGVGPKAALALMDTYVAMGDAIAKLSPMDGMGRSDLAQIMAQIDDAFGKPWLRIAITQLTPDARTVQTAQNFARVAATYGPNFATQPVVSSLQLSLSGKIPSQPAPH